MKVAWHVEMLCVRHREHIRDERQYTRNASILLFHSLDFESESYK